MLAVIDRAGEAATARFERHWEHRAEDVWAFLTENDKLAQWFPELRADDLRKGGAIRFNMPDGTSLDMDILELKPYSVLEYTWGEDRVRFELISEPEGCRLILLETMNKITEHTPKDLAGWHVCLDVIGLLLDGKTMASRKSVWETWYRQYVELLEKPASS